MIYFTHVLYILSFSLISSKLIINFGQLVQRIGQIVQRIKQNFLYFVQSAETILYLLKLLSYFFLFFLLYIFLLSQNKTKKYSFFVCLMSNSQIYVLLLHLDLIFNICIPLNNFWSEKYLFWIIPIFWGPALMIRSFTIYLLKYRQTQRCFQQKQGPTRHRPMAHPVVFRYVSYSTTLAEHAVHRLRQCPDYGRAGTCLFSSVQ